MAIDSSDEMPTVGEVRQRQSRSLALGKRMWITVSVTAVHL